MKKRSILIGIVSVVLIAGLVLTGCLPKTGSSSTGSTDQAQNDRLSALESWKGTADSKIATLTGSAGLSESDVNAMIEEALASENDNSKLVELEDRIAELEDEVADLDGGNGGSGDSKEPSTTRWTPSVEFDGLDAEGWVENNYSIDIDRHPSSIRAEDSYKITVTVTNESGDEIAACDDVVLWVYFTPSSRDTNIDIYDTGLYFTGEDGISSHGSIFWDSEFSPSDGIGCRWMEFISEEFDVEALAAGASFKINFDFDLVYAD